MAEYHYTIIIESADPREDAATRIQVEVARHLAVLFPTMFKGVTPDARK